VDDRGSGWSSRPGDQDRLAWVEDDLAGLQDDVTRVIRILPGRLASGQRTTLPGWDEPNSTDEGSVTSGHGGRGGTPPVRYPSDPIGRVEKQLDTLDWEVQRLLRILGLPARPTAPRSTSTPISHEEPSRPPRRDTTPLAVPEAVPPRNDVDTEAGDDLLGDEIAPSEGPGGAGPYHRPRSRRRRATSGRPPSWSPPPN
jgi:hypothetical protein